MEVYIGTAVGKAELISDVARAGALGCPTELMRPTPEVLSIITDRLPRFVS